VVPTNGSLRSGHDDAQNARRLHASDRNAAECGSVSLVDRDRQDVAAQELRVKLRGVLLAYLDNFGLVPALLVV
jgi:hypothetical protein